jgi:GNAT superfamily N-acetyltransferase
LKEDADRSFAFFQSLPEDDRRFLRYDVTERANIDRRIKEIGFGHVHRIVAVVGDEIVADGALELSGGDWTKHVGEFRLIVARGYQRKGLGMLMARELYTLATSHKVEEIIVRMAAPQSGARKIFTRLGFREHTVIPGIIKDRTGAKQDMVVMRCNLDAMWTELENFFEHSDWQRTR